MAADVNIRNGAFMIKHESGWYRPVAGRLSRSVRSRSIDFVGGDTA